MTTYSITAQTRPAAPTIHAGAAFARLMARIDAFFDRLNTRDALSHLDDHLLEDIGLTPEYIRRNRADLQNGGYVFSAQNGMASPATK